MSDKKISELPVASAINLSDVSVLVKGGTNYQYTFTGLLQLISSSLNVGANISFGTALPANTFGKNGDVFIKTNTGSFAQKMAGVWTIAYTLPATGGITDGTVLYGLGIPDSGIGNNNDTYINTGTGVFYKKSAGVWAQVFSMQTGPQGPQGVAGTNGTNGTNGYSLLSGNTLPSNSSTGVNGDFYLNNITYTLYGPKTGGVWGDGVSLIGLGIEPGGTAGQVLTKVSNNDYDVSWATPIIIDDNTISVSKVYSSQKTATLISNETLARTAADDALQTQIEGLQAFINGDDIDLDTIKELADAIKADESVLATLTTNKLNTADVYNALDRATAGKALDARQGKALNDLITVLSGKVVPVGGSAGQVLAKVSDDDHDVGWVDAESTVSNSFGTLFYTSTVSWDYSLRRNQSLVLYGNAVVQINNMNDGDVALLIIKQDEIGSRTIRILGEVKVSGSIAGEIELSTEGSREDSLYIMKKGLTLYVQVFKNYVGVPIDQSIMFLDSFSSNIKAAFSTSKLFSTSTTCLRIRRSSDNVEQDFGFVEGILDIAGIVNFIGVSDGFITKWYDQSINGAHYTQSTEVHQPKIKFNSLNGLPALEFNGTSSFMTSGNFLDSSFNQNCTFFTLAKKYTYGFLLHECAANPATWYASRNNGSVFNGTGAITCNAFKNDDTKLYLDTYKYDGNKAYAYVNNTLYNSHNKSGDIGFSGYMTIGGITGGGYWWNGEIHTKIYLNTALSEANLKAIGKKLALDYSLVTVPQIHFDGNSLTAGTNSSDTTVAQYPGYSYPSRLIQALGGTSNLTFRNQGKGGANTEAIDAHYSVANIYNTNGFASKLIEIFWEGRNSIALGDTAVQAYDAMIAYLTKYKFLGYKIAVLTCQPTSNPAVGSIENFENQRLIYNQMIRDNLGSSIYDYVVDIAADLRVGSLANIGNTTYWDFSGVHLTDTGYLVIAELVADTLNEMLNN